MNYLRMKLKALLACADRFIGYLKTVTGYPCICDNGIKSVIQEYKICGNEGGVGNVNDEGTYDIPITVSGKNLFNPENAFVKIIGTYSNTKCYVVYGYGSPKGVYREDKYNFFNAYCDLKAGKTYTISLKFYFTSGKRINTFVIGFHGVDGSTTSQINNNNILNNSSTASDGTTLYSGKLTITPTVDIDKFCLSTYDSSYPKAYVPIDTIQIEENTTNTAYEPYREPYQYNINLQNPLGLHDYLDNTGIAVHYDGEPSPNLFKFEYMNDNRSSGVHFYNENLDTDLLQPGTYYFKIGKIVTLKGSETMTDSDGNTVNVADSDTSSIKGRYLMRLYDENKKLVQKPIANGWLKDGLGNTFDACYDAISNNVYLHTQRSGDINLEQTTKIILLKPAYLQLGYADGSASQTGNTYTNMSKSKSLHPILAKGSLPSEYSAYNRSEESFAAPVMQIGKDTNIITAETDVKPSNIEATYYNTEVQDEV